MIRTFFGAPGTGKTTLAVKMALKNQKKYKKVYLNFYHKIPKAYICDLDGLGEWTFPKGSYIGIDEAGIEYNNRAYKTLPKATIKWLKLHRHHKCNVDVFSQSWDDMDVTIRRLSTELWYLYKIGPFTLARRVTKRVTVDRNTEQIIDGYSMPSLLWLLIWFLQLDTKIYPFCMFSPKFKLTFRPYYYKYFDTYAVNEDLPIKEFQRNK